MNRSKIIMAMILIFAMGICPVVQVKADAAEKPYLSLGADLSADQKSVVLSLLGVSADDLSSYEVVEVTNEEEHEYLGDYLAASVIGSKALSSVRIEKLEEGSGIGVETKNITYCTSGMYTNALTTAGVVDAQVTVAGPFEISGTAALVGVMKAYSDMTGEDLLEKNTDVATNELVLTGELAEALGADKATQLVAMVKEKVLAGGDTSDEGIKKMISESSKQLDVDLSGKQGEEISGLMKKIKDLDLDVDKIKQQAGDVYDGMKALDEKVEVAQSAFQKLVNFFERVAEKIVSWITNIFG